MSWLLWLLIGIVVGAAIVWTIIKRKIDEQTAAIEASYDGRLRHLQAEVGRADQAHEETKVTLHELLADRNAADERAGRLDEELAAARKATAAAQAQGARLDGEVAAAKNDVSALKTELAKCREQGIRLEAQKAEAEVRIAELEASAAASREASAGQSASAGQNAPAGGDVGTPPPGAAAAGNPAEAAARLRDIDSRLAALPAGTTAYTALSQEREELSRFAGGDLPLPGLPAIDTEPPAARPAAGSAAQRIKAIDARLKMLPAGSSARTALLAEKARLAGGGSEPAPPSGANPASPLPPKPADATPDDLEIIKGIGPFINRELVAMGIVTFAQLVALTPAQIDYLEDKIGFPGRVGREHWIEQARELMAGRPSA